MAEPLQKYNNLPRSFTDNRVDGSILPPIIGKEVEFDPTRDRYVKKHGEKQVNLYGQAEAERAKLKIALASFQNTVGAKLKIDVDINQFQTWEEVERVVGEVKRQYEAKLGAMAATRRFFDRIGKNGGTFTAWLGLLPDGEYSSVVCGAFKLIIKAAIKVKEVRESIFDALGSIPTTLANAKLYTEMWKSVELHREFSKLYTAILEVFEHMLSWLLEKHHIKVLKVFGQQDSYEDKLKRMLRAVEECATSVREQASICSQWVIGSVNQKMDKQIRYLDGMKVTVEKVYDGVHDVGSSVQDLKIGQAEVQDRLNAMYVMLCGVFRDSLRKATSTANSDVKSAAKGITLIRYLRGCINVIDARSEAPVLKQRKLRRLLRHDPEAAQIDVDRTLRAGQVFNLHEQERTEYLMVSSRFKQWLTSRQSEVLLVNGRAETSNRCSPISFACGLLVSSLGSFPSTITLNFFCALHTDSSDTETGAKMMLASFLCQLLEQYQDFDLSFLAAGQKYDLQERDVDTLCSLFETLLRQLPEGQLAFCMIDGISYYESRDRRDDTCKVLAMLVALTEDEKLKAVFKLMISSPTTSRYVSDIVDLEDVFALPETIEHTNQGFNSQAFGKRAKRQIRDVETKVNPEATWSSDSEDDLEESEESE